MKNLICTLLSFIWLWGTIVPAQAFNTLDNVQQIVLTATPSKTSSYAAVTAYEQTQNGDWIVKNTTENGRVGKNGIEPIPTRKQSSNQTPQGIMKLMGAFGIADNPGALFPYTKITNNMYWDLNSGTSNYNRLVYKNPGGNYEHLIGYQVPYKYMFTTDYNIEQAAEKGGAIFFHCNGTKGPTSGCISVPEETMKWYMKWLDPSKNPVIIVTTKDDICTYFAKVNTTASRSGTAFGNGLYTTAQTVTVSAVSNNGKPFIGWYDRNGNFLSGQLTYTFQPVQDMKIYAMFEGDYFYDVHNNDWFTEYAVEAAKKGVMSGTAPYCFDGNQPLSRAMAVQILYSLSNSPTVSSEKVFTDVSSESWYGKAVAWAVKEGIAFGTGKYTFSPDSSITREQFAVMLYNYMGKPEISGTLTFPDTDRVSNWALDAVTWANQNAVINGKKAVDDNILLDPQGQATRAETAAMVIKLLAISVQ